MSETVSDPQRNDERRDEIDEIVRDGPESTGTAAESGLKSTEELRLRPPRNRVSSRALGWWTVQAAVFAVPLPLTFGILWAAIPPTRTVFMWLTLGFLLPGLLYVAVMPIWRHRVHRWEITDEAVYAASGWLWQQWRVAPLSRVQTVDTLRGPLQQMFGLSGVTVSTASAAGAVKIKGIDHEVAEELVAELTRFTQATAEDAA